MQLSRHQVFVFVEGRDLDPDVYSRICAPVCKSANKSYEIVIADRMADPGGGGGKGVVTRFFEFLRDNSWLIDGSSNRKLSIFYLDKDVDDVFRRLRVSNHVVYTRLYSLENHLFKEGNLLSSLATAGSVDAELLRSAVTDPAHWRAEAAHRWRDWVALCLLARKLHLPHPVSYSLPGSRVNSPVDGPVDPAALESNIAQVQSASRLTAVVFKKKLTAVYRLVDRVYGRADHDLIFKGKWYAVFASGQLELVSPVHNKNGAVDRLYGALIASVNFEGAWVEHFRRPLRVAIAAM
jgi:hypothetical protein